MKAVIFDSNPAAGEALASLLAKRALDVWLPGSAEEALSEMSGEGGCLALIDFDGEAGRVLCQQARSAPGGDLNWVVALLSKSENIPQALESGANDFLLKPVTEVAVRSRLLFAEGWMGVRRRHLEAEKAAHYKVSTRAQQQAAVAALGQCALVGVDLKTLMSHTVLFLAQTLDAVACAVFEVTGDGGELVLREGVGWDEGAGELPVIPAGYGTGEGRALREEPVLVTDWLTETRFSYPEVLRRRGIRSSVMVGIAGAAGPFGVLAAHGVTPESFTEEDVHFVQAVAILLGIATERKRSEEAIQRLAAFAQCNPNPVVEINDTGGVTYANEAAEVMARNLDRPGVAGLLPGNVAEIVRETLASGGRRVEERIKIARRTIEWAFFPVVASGVVHCYGEDVTDRIEMQGQLRQLQKMECVGQLAAGLAHDFNNILTVIRGHAEMLLVDTAGIPEKKVASMTRILNAADRAANLTRQLLTFGRKEVATPVPLDINQCLAGVVKMVDRVLREDIELKFDPSANLPAVLGDAGMLDQVIMNLAVNARDAMPRGGRLVLTTSFVEVDATYVRRHPGARTGRFVCLSVTDTGCGMDAETVGRIFEPFFTTKEAGKGTGLGLATVYGIVQQHQGWIEVVSRVGEGTTFLVFLPCMESSAVQSASPGEVVAVAGGNETILVVEDEPTLREISRLILQSYGYKVIEAASGIEALRIWQREKGRIDLVFTDVVMPDGLDGIALSRKLTGEKESLKVVFASGYGSQVISHDAIPKGRRFIPKPYPAQMLARAVREELDSSSMTAPPREA